jgi:heptosyltransferase-2/heptosyltransferase-3
VLDRTQLAERNRRLASFQHRLSWRERIRRDLLKSLSRVPISRDLRPRTGTFLLIRPDHLGDMLLTMPAITALKKAQPTSKLYALVGEWSAPVIDAYPEVDQVLTVRFPGFTRRAKAGWVGTPYAQAVRWSRMLRQLHIETAVILRPDHWWGAMLAWLAGIPNRVGYDLPDVAPFLTEALPAPVRSPYKPAQREHTVMQSIRLLHSWTGDLTPDQIKLTYPIYPSDREYIADRLANAQLPLNKKLVVIHPGAGTQFKRWLPEHWAIVADRLAERLDASILFTGSDQEYPEIYTIMEKMRSRGVSLAGDTNVGQLVALYERAEVVLGPDSGPLHLAVASGTPTVHLYGPADPALFGPWGDPSRHIVLTSGIACHPCNILAWPGDKPEMHPCIRDITPRQVLDAAFKVIEPR